LGLKPKSFLLWTMHRPSNVDDPKTLAAWVAAMRKIAIRVPIVFPVHPRTKRCLLGSGLWTALGKSKGVVLTEPLGYLECLSLSSQCLGVVTDSGGLQEEATSLRVPCLTLRENTERPITVTQGTSTLVGQNTELLISLVEDLLEGRYKKGSVPKLWDGRAAQRIAANLMEFLNS
jgi:UDP-N-acetylglucosamine 2-epimerase (non-hydrolysing)